MSLQRYDEFSFGTLADLPRQVATAWPGRSMCGTKILAVADEATITVLKLETGVSPTSRLITRWN